MIDCIERDMLLIQIYFVLIKSSQHIKMMLTETN